MIKMHKNELNIDEYLVYALLKKQFPRGATLPLKAISSSGTSNALFRLGAEYIVRLPLIDWGNTAESIEKEYKWVPQIAPFLGISLSLPLFKGNADASYPLPWIIARWNEGHNPDYEKENEYEYFAKDLASFLNELHTIPLAHGPFGRRGVHLKEMDESTKQAISELHEEIDSELITRVWNRLSTIPAWTKDPIWIHGDFLPGNILIKKNRLSAVIDFSDLGIGDPACDFIISWSLFNSRSRQAFKEKLIAIDEDTWQRGRGWALSIALIIIPYYKNSNPVLTKIAWRMIKNVLNDF